MERYAVTEIQLHTNGAIACASLDHGTDKAGALSHYHMALASGVASGLVAMTATMTVMDDQIGIGHTTSETVKGTGVLNIEGGTNE